MQVYIIHRVSLSKACVTFDCTTGFKVAHPDAQLCNGVPGCVTAWHLVMQPDSFKSGNHMHADHIYSYVRTYITLVI